MRVEDLLKEINKYVDQLDFITARKLIESNLEVLNKHKYQLKSNARELLKIFTDRLESGVEPISRKDMASLIAINKYASNFDMASIKLIVRNNAKLLLREDAIDYLNRDAKAILEGMGVIKN